MWKINIDIRSFYEQFVKEYEFLYDNDDMVAGYTEAVEAFDDFVKWFPEFVREFARFRGDFISSDREAAAFMFALDVLMDDGEERKDERSEESNVRGTYVPVMEV